MRNFIFTYEMKYVKLLIFEVKEMHNVYICLHELKEVHNIYTPGYMLIIVSC